MTSASPLAQFDEPVFVMTSDIDWASEACIEDFLGVVCRNGIIPTCFVTHDSPVLRTRATAGEVDLGLHPNFLPGSSHGTGTRQVIDHVLALAPGARCYRGHHMIDSSDASILMAEKGIRYDSNLQLWMQPGLVPLHHWTGILRLPAFWADDVHWRLGQSWRFEDHAQAFFTPGLKIISSHPFLCATNTPDAAFYAAIKPEIQTMSRDRLEAVRHAGPGTRTFVLELIEAVERRGLRFTTLAEVDRRYRETTGWGHDLP